MNEMKQFIAPHVFSVMRRVELPVTDEGNKKPKLTSSEEILLDWYLEKYLKIKRNPVKTKWRVVWEPAPCECTDTVICAYCVLANMILWEKEELSPKEKSTLGTFEKMEKGKLAKILGVNPSTVHRWLKLKRIPNKYIEKFDHKVLQGGC